MRPFIRFHFTDGGARKAQVRLYPHDTSASLVSSGRVLTIAAAMSGVSDAAIVKAEVIYPVDISIIPLDAVNSNVNRSAVLFYRNGGDTASFAVPSARPVLAEVTGEYAGGRITRDSLGVLDLLPLVDALLTGFIDPAGRPYGSSFSVGGFTGL